MKAGAVFCFRCRKRFEPGEPECPHCLVVDEESGAAPLFVVRPSLPTRWFLAGVAFRFGGVLALAAVFLIPLWSFEPRGLELPRWVVGSILALFVLGFVLPNSVRWLAARRAARHSEFRFHADRIEYVNDPLSREERSLPFEQVLEATVRRSPFLPGRGRILLRFEAPEGPSELAIECVVEPERVLALIRERIKACRAGRTVA